MRQNLRIVTAAWLALLTAIGGAAAQLDDEGYYYPPVTSEEIFTSLAATLPDANRERRIEFMREVSLDLLQRPFAPSFVMFTAGDEADRLVVSVNSRLEMETPYQARALMQGFTTVAQTLPFMAEYQVQDLFTFLDVAKLLGFESVVVTDGKNFAHRFVIE